MTATLAYINILSPDIDRLAGFYQALFGFIEIAEHRAPIHCALDAGGCAMGFNADPAHELLLLERAVLGAGDRIFLTFELGNSVEVDHAVDRALQLGATLVKPASETGYGWYQAVLRDLDGNALRINTVNGAALQERIS